VFQTKGEFWMGCQGRLPQLPDTYGGEDDVPTMSYNNYTTTIITNNYI
jgi:hypothetical protein